MHHLILVRAPDPDASGAIGCCCRIGRDDVRWGAAPPAPPDDAAAGFRELYRALRERFGDRLRITVLDPRNLLAYLPLVARDAVRHRVPPGAALRALGGASFATGVLDGRLLFSGARIPASAEVLRVVAARLNPAAPEGVEGT